MSKKKVEETKIRLNDEEEDVSPPWQAFYHTVKKMKFYWNKDEKYSIWEHPTRSKPALNESSKIERKFYPNEILLKEDSRINQSIESTSSEMVSDQPFLKRKRVAETTEESQDTSLIGKYVYPKVPWACLVQPRQIIPYRGCAIFDTNIFIDKPDIVSVTKSKQILAVVPYSVILELDGLKKNESIQVLANDACRKLQKMKADKEYYLELETSTEQQINIQPYFTVINESKDDFILKCALRVKLELISVLSVLKIHQNGIVFVSNDLNLKLKAEAHQMTVVSLNEFLETIGESNEDRYSPSRETNINNLKPVYNAQQPGSSSKKSHSTTTKKKESIVKKMTLELRQKPKKTEKTEKEKEKFVSPVTTSELFKIRRPKMPITWEELNSQDVDEKEVGGEESMECD